MEETVTLNLGQLDLTSGEDTGLDGLEEMLAKYEHNEVVRDILRSELEVVLVRRGCRPLGGGEVQLRMAPLLRLPATLRWSAPGLVKRVRGVAKAG